MNASIPGFSAVYDNRSASPCMQQPGFMQPSMPFQTGQDTSGLTGLAGIAQSPMPAQQQQGMQSSSIASVPITDLTQPQPMTTESIQFLNGFLRTQIGKRVRVEFLVGTNTYLEKSGKLLAVGANYIILQEAMTDDLLVCDFFNIKFTTIFR